jgi:hypothetical protein
MARKLPPIAGMDYVAIPGMNPDLSFGVVRRELKGRVFETGEAVLRRLRPVGGLTKPEEVWVPTCYRSDVLLPPNAEDRLSDAKALCGAYEAQAFPGIKDLLIVVTLRFPATSAPLHDIWEDVRAFALDFVRSKGVAAILAMHVPALAGKAGRSPHVHIMIPARRLERYAFGEFLPNLACDAGRDTIETTWNSWSARRESDATRRG